MNLPRLAWPLLLVAVLVPWSGARAAGGWVPRLGIEASGQYGTVSRTSKGFPVIDAVYGGGWSLGATAEWMLSPRWIVASGLRYLESGQSQKVTVTASGTGGPLTVRGDLHDTWRWLAVPVHAKVAAWAPLSFEAGPELQVLLVAKSHQVLEDDGSNLRRTGEPSPTVLLAPTAGIFEEVGTFGGDRDVTHLYRRVNVVLGGGVSTGWPMRSGRLVVHARGGFGLNDLMKSDAIESRTRTVEVGAGWQW